ncbi:hypothetical protein AGR7A_pAt30096 [Agrobacterium deltaense NCPPB 1641]|uniref:DNA (cytosine-5-)-methyltransferase n=1 Tax=Agrobacterium deltaense NCPPB 1641 TaxID=1183425 RepID=A0A1S7UCE0_9HYPH|nr:hypothetical protein AGR7A_pAt30096 [Agrobacterium deltaense NCPPB 1641]
MPSFARRDGEICCIERINFRDHGVAWNPSKILVVGVTKDIEGSVQMPPRFPKMSIHMGDVFWKNFDGCVTGPKRPSQNPRQQTRKQPNVGSILKLMNRMRTTRLP